MKNLKFAVTTAKILPMALGILFWGCANKTKLIDVYAISTTYSSVPNNKILQEIGPVKNQNCVQSFTKANSTSGTKNISNGLFDEAIIGAQTKLNADFILHAKLYQDGSCFTVEGTAAKLITIQSLQISQPASLPKKTRSKK